MNRHATLTTCLAHLLVALMLAAAPGCTLIGVAVGSAADSSGTSGVHSTADASTGGDTEVTRWQMGSRPSRTESHAGAVTGGLVGLALDTIAVVAVAVAVSNIDFMSGWDDGTSFSSSDCTSSCGSWGCC